MSRAATAPAVRPAAALPAAASPAAAAPPAPDLGERIRAWGHRLMASDRFRRWAASFPLTRPIALRRSRQIFDLCAGFVYTQVLLACEELGLLELLADGARGADDIAARLELDGDAARRLLDAAVSLELLSLRRDGRYGLGPLGAPMVGNRAIRAMVMHNRLLYEDLRDPVALLRRSTAEAPRLAGYWPYAAAAEPRALAAEQVDGYTRLMAESQPLIADEVLDAYDFSAHRRVLDLGGGEGAFLQAVALRTPALHVSLFDLPAVAARARERLRGAGLAERAQVHGGDFLRDPLPPGADLITLVRVLHDLPDADALALLCRARDALPPGGAVLVAEPLAGARGAETVGGAYFALYLLAMGGGRARSAAEYAALLGRAGFRSVRHLRARLPVQVGVVVARA